LCYSIITGFICESCAIRSLHVVCACCAIPSLHSFVVRVVLFYHYRLYLWELCYSISTWFIQLSQITYNDRIGHVSQTTWNDRIAQLWQISPVMIEESCAILSLQGLFVRVVLFYHYRVYLWELCYPIIPCCLWDMSYSIIIGILQINHVMIE
jgi:hypothetical protein